MLEKLLLSLLGAALLAQSAWVYHTGSRVTAVEVQNVSVQENLQVIREDVREIRKALLGPKAP